MKVEYLVLIDSKEEFCKSVTSLNNLIQSYDQILIVDKIIKYLGCDFTYSVQLGDPENTEHRFFHIKVGNTKKDNLVSFQQFLKLLRVILSKISGLPVEVLNDDLSSSRCITAYPIIHNIENKMRKLITKFMLTNIGLGWTKEQIPKEVVDSLKSSKVKPANFLYEIDFIQLSKFLFNNYASLDSKKIVEKINAATSIEDLDLSELREFVPQSNWDRYFAKIVDCTNEFLEKRWKRLYDIRNKIAHNRFISEDELEDLTIISREVDEKLQAAIDNLDKIHITTEQKEEVAENIAFNRDEWYADFLGAWNQFLEALQRIALIVAKEDSKKRVVNGKNWRAMINLIIANTSIGKEYKTQFIELSAFRSTLLHQTDVIFTQESILERMALLIKLYDELIALENSLQ